MREDRGKERMEDRDSMRARALEMDAHQECIGSSVAPVAAVATAAAAVATAVKEFGATEEAEEEEEEGEALRWMSMASSSVGIDGNGVRRDRRWNCGF